MSQLDIADELFCPGCGYSLRGIQSPRCPECGLAIDRKQIHRSSVPWTHRKRIGRIGAFVRTIWFITKSPRAISHDVARPVNYRDAQKFRWLVVLLAWAPLAIALLVLRGMFGDLPGPGFYINGRFPIGPMHPLMDLAICWSIGVRSWIVPGIAVFLFLAGITGAPSFFFFPKTVPAHRQSRAAALSFYGCAPLALLFIPSMSLGIAGLMYYADEFMKTNSQFQRFVLLQLLGYAMLVVLPVLYWFRTLQIMKLTLQCSGTRLTSAAIGLPLIGLTLAILTLIAFPALYGLVELMIASYLQ